VQSYLDAAKVRLVVTDGADVRSVYSCRRNISRALDTALRARDRCWCVPGCGATFRLERDHIKEYARSGPTTLDNLCLLCSRHHKMKSTKGFRIEGSPVLLSGDTLFPGGAGNTKTDLGDFDRIIESIDRRLYAVLGDDVVVMPGHGDDTTIGTERPRIDEWAARGW
jgi:hypothetical protein